MAGRMITPIQSVLVASATTVFVPSGGRIWYVTGEADGKTTYDFIVTHNAWAPSSGTVVGYSVKHCGKKNGARTNLMKLYPVLNTVGSTPTATGHQAISVTSGTGVALQLFYLTGAVAN